MAPIVLRDYQQQLLADLRAALKVHRRVCAVMPTGAGKGQTIGAIVQGAAGKGRRVLVLAHRAELIEQLTGTVRAWGLEPDVIAPGHQLQGRQVAVGSVQTVVRRLEQLPAPDLIIQDEAHHLVAGNVWGRIINAWPERPPDRQDRHPRAPRRQGAGRGGRRLFRGPGAGALSGLAGGAGLAGQAQGLLLARRQEQQAPRALPRLRRMGEFDLEQAARAFGDRAAIGDAVSHYRRRLHPGTAICFCCTIEHAEQMAAAFRAAGIRAASVSGGTPAEERKRLIAGLGTGEVEVLSSCMIISEGTDIPSVGGAILMRPTASLSLYLQMVGRALRPAPGKQEAVILDHVGNAHRHGLPTDEREWNLAGRRRREGVSIPIKDCPVCFCSCPSAAQVCPDCGHLFLAEERDEQRRGIQQLEGELVEVTGAARHRPKPNQQQRPRRTHPAAGCRTFEQLLEREQERGYKSGWARHVWAARQRST